MSVALKVFFIVGFLSLPIATVILYRRLMRAMAGIAPIGGGGGRDTKR